MLISIGETQVFHRERCGKKANRVSLDIVGVAGTFLVKCGTAPLRASAKHRETLVFPMFLHFLPVRLLVLFPPLSASARPLAVSNRRFGNRSAQCAPGRGPIRGERRNSTRAGGPVGGQCRSPVHASRHSSRHPGHSLHRPALRESRPFTLAAWIAAATFGSTLRPHLRRHERAEQELFTSDPRPKPPSRRGFSARFGGRIDLLSEAIGGRSQSGAIRRTQNSALAIARGTKQTDPHSQSDSPAIRPIMTIAP